MDNVVENQVGFAQAMTSLLGGDPVTGQGLQFDPPPGTTMDQISTPAQVEKAAGDTVSNMYEDQTGGMSQNRSATGEEKKQSKIDELLNIKDESFVVDNKGKLLGILAGTALQMIGVHNSNPGLMIAGGTISGLARSELEKWHEGWNARVAEAMKDTENKTTSAEKRMVKDRLQAQVDELGAKVGDDKEAEEVIKKAGEEVTPENIALVKLLEPTRKSLAEGRQMDLEEGVLGDEKVNAVNTILTEFPRETKASGQATSLEGATPEERINELKAWKAKKQKEPGYEGLATVQEEDLVEVEASMYGTGGATISADAADPGRENTSDRRSEKHSTFRTEANAPYIDNSPMSSLEPQAALNKSVQVTDSMIRRNPILGSTSPGARRYGDVVKNMIEHLREAADPAKDPKTGETYIYLPEGAAPYSEKTQPDVVPKKRRQIKVLSAPVNSATKWYEQLDRAISTGNGYDEEFLNYIGRLSTTMLGPPKMEEVPPWI